MKVADMPPDPNHPGKHINPATGIWPIEEWGRSRGFVSNSRFARPGDTVIPRTNRNVTRRWRRGSSAPYQSAK